MTTHPPHSEVAATTVTLADIEAARDRIMGTIRTTPLFEKQVLTQRFGVPVFVKDEHLQRTGSFKIRGAMNLISQLDPSDHGRGVVAASAGNHAQGVAVAAAEHGVHATIFMPAGATLSKVEATRGYGAKVVLSGEHLSEALEAAQAYAAATGAILVHPFNDVRIIAGQGTLGLELVEQLPDIATVILPIGGGGLFAGVATAIRALRPQCRIIGVQAEACQSISASRAAGHPVPIHAAGTMADGIAVKQPGAITYPIIESLIDELVIVDDNEIASAILWLMERAKQVVEGAGAATMAALLADKVTPVGPTVCVLSGGNIDPMALIPILRRGLGTTGRFLRIATILTDRPGELSRLLVLLAQMKVNVLTVEHRREGEPLLHVGETGVDLTLQTRNPEHVVEVLDELRTAGYAVRER
ncbi:MAG: threonine ammonia-lyase [Thermoleophilia bacterium]|nr:threonine ammonia-lyase [Thermoleophilia bacterium]